MNPATATPHALGLLMLEGDPLYRKIAGDERLPLVKSALADGRNRALDVLPRWGNDPDAIARGCDIPVTDSLANADYGNTVVFAEYLQRPARIVLYRPAIGRIDAAIETHASGTMFASRTARSMLLAHELYHHFDGAGPRAPLARRHRVTLLKWGPWRWTSGLTSLPEIAAGAFAQALLDLPFHPKALELLLTIGLESGPAPTSVARVAPICAR